MAPVMSISPKASERPYLRSGGEYGHGRTHDCQVELVKLDVPSEKGPGYDRDCKDDTYCQFTFKVVHEEDGVVFINHWEPLSEGSGSKALQFLHDIAPTEVDSDTGEFDPETIAPRPCAIEVKDPREDKNGNMWTGNITNVFAA